MTRRKRTVKIRELTNFLEDLAPLSYQEDYDNSGLITGDANAEINGVLISLDCTEQIVDEAISKGCNLIISHHPIVFKGLKKFTGRSYVERVIIAAIKNDVAIYAIHTNLDHVSRGVNARICDKLGLIGQEILLPKAGLLRKLSVFTPLEHADSVRTALFAAGSGHIGSYSDCSFNSDGYGTFKASDKSQPYSGIKGELHFEKEVKIEVIFTDKDQKKIISALRATHPYEEIAYDIFFMENTHPYVGAGMLGVTKEPIEEKDFLELVKDRLQVSVIRHTKYKGSAVNRVAVCGGSGSFLLKHAIAAKADVFISSDFKYHEFFDAEDKLVIADIGHFESEQFTQELLFEVIQNNFVNFALHLTVHNTNPINYLI